VRPLQTGVVKKMAEHVSVPSSTDVTRPTVECEGIGPNSPSSLFAKSEFGRPSLLYVGLRLYTF